MGSGTQPSQPSHNYVIGAVGALGCQLALSQQFPTCASAMKWRILPWTIYLHGQVRSRPVSKTDPLEASNYSWSVSLKIFTPESNAVDIYFNFANVIQFAHIYDLSLLRFPRHHFLRPPLSLDCSQARPLPLTNKLGE